MISIVTSKCVDVTSGTSLSCNVSASAGDFVLATVSVRSTYALSTGWEGIYESGTIISNDGATQKMIFAKKKVIETGNVDIQVTQSTALRLYINLIVIRGINDIKARPDLEVINSTPVSEMSVLAKGQNAIIWGCSAILWNTSSPYGLWSTSPSDLDIVSLDQKSAQPRQANFIDLGTGALSRKFNTPAETASIVSAVELMVSDERYFVKDGDSYYTVADNTLISISNFSPTKEFIMEKGMAILPNAPCILELQHPSIICWNSNEDVNVRINYTSLPKTQIVIQNYDVDFSHESISSIRRVAINAVIPDSADVRFAISMDSGAAWNAFDGVQWRVIDMADFALKGMTQEAIEVITNDQWITLTDMYGTYKYRFAIYLDANSTDLLTLSDIVVNYKNT